MKEIFVAHSEPFDLPTQAYADPLIAEIKSRHGRAKAVYPIGRWYDDVNLALIKEADAIVAVFNNPNESLKHYVLEAHWLGLPALVYLQEEQSTEGILGDGLQSTERYDPADLDVRQPSSEWLTEDTANPKAITISRRGSRIVKLKNWMDHELGLHWQHYGSRLKILDKEDADEQARIDRRTRAQGRDPKEIITVDDGMF